jgi:thiamine transporter
MQNMNTRLMTLIEGAIVAGLGVALGFVQANFGPGNGFDLSLGLIPFGIFAIRRGLAPALLTGLAWALIKIVMGGATFMLDPRQWLLDYLFAFVCAGFIGVFSSRVLAAIREDNAIGLISWVSATAFLGIFARWFCHFVSGFLFWGEYAPKGQSPVVYSLVANGVSFFGNMVMVVCVLTLLARFAPIVYLVGIPRKAAS